MNLLVFLVIHEIENNNMIIILTLKEFVLEDIHEY